MIQFWKLYFFLKFFFKLKKYSVFTFESTTATTISLDPPPEEETPAAMLMSHKIYLRLMLLLPYMRAENRISNQIPFFINKTSLTHRATHFYRRPSRKSAFLFAEVLRPHFSGRCTKTMALILSVGWFIWPLGHSVVSGGVRKMRN